MGQWTYGMDWWVWALMIAGTVGLWAIAIAAARAVFHVRPTKAHPTSVAGEDALALLEDRLARGELNPEEYRRARESLTRRA